MGVSASFSWLKQVTWLSPKSGVGGMWGHEIYLTFMGESPKSGKKGIDTGRGEELGPGMKPTTLSS